MLITILLLYFIVLLIIGWWFKGRIQTSEDFLVSGRSLSWPVILLTFTATWIGGAATLGQTALGFNTGISAVQVNIAGAVSLYILALLAGRIRDIGAKYGIVTVPDFVNRRFGKTAALLTALIVLWTLVAVMGSQLVAVARVVEVMGPSWLRYETIVVLSSIIIILYTVWSGLYGVAYTDVVQGAILLIILGIMVPIMSVNATGGLVGLKTKLPASFFKLSTSPQMFGMVWVYLLTYFVGPVYWQRIFASKDSRTAKIGFIGGATIIILYTFSITLTGMAARVLVPDLLKSGVPADTALPLIGKQLFPIGISSLMCAAMLAVLMSTIDSYLLCASQTVGYDLYKMINPDVEDSKIVRISRLWTVVLGLSSIVFALYIRDVYQALIFAFTFYGSRLVKWWKLFQQLPSDDVDEFVLVHQSELCLSERYSF